MGHCDRTSLFDLCLEPRDHRSVRSKYVSETGRDELGRMLLLFCDLLGQRLYVYLAYPLAASHHIGRIHSLIRRHHYKLFDSILHGKVRKHTGSHDIVLDRFIDIILHHRHMFVSSSMEDILRTISLEYAFNPCLI